VSRGPGCSNRSSCIGSCDGGSCREALTRSLMFLISSASSSSALLSPPFAAWPGSGHGCALPMISGCSGPPASRARNHSQKWHGRGSSNFNLRDCHDQAPWEQRRASWTPSRPQMRWPLRSTAVCDSPFHAPDPRLSLCPWCTRLPSVRMADADSHHCPYWQGAAWPRSRAWTRRSASEERATRKLNRRSS